MALKPSAPSILVTPTGKNNESEQGRLIVVENDTPSEQTYRGVVEAVGKLVAAEIKPGDVAHYNRFIPLFDKHIVPETHLVAYEDSE